MTTKLRASRGDPSRTTTAAYFDGLLAWGEEKACTTNLLCLRSGRTRLWVDEDRVKANHIAVSELLVATCNRFGDVCVHNHLTDDEYTFKLSSANVRGFALRSTTLAILFDREINVWNLRTQKACRIPLVSLAMPTISGISDRHQSFRLQFAANGRDFICSSVVLDSTSPGKVIFLRVSSDGVTQEVSTEYEISTSYISTRHETCQSNVDDFHTFGRIKYNYQYILIGYDESRNQPQFHVLGSSYRRWPPDAYYQKHVLYQSQDARLNKRSGNAIRRVVVKDLNDQHSTEWKITKLDDAVDVDRKGQGLSSHKVLGDETFLVHIYPSHIIAYCFDQNSEGGYSWTKLRPSPLSHKK